MSVTTFQDRPYPGAGIMTEREIQDIITAIGQSSFLKAHRERLIKKMTALNLARKESGK